MTDSDSLAICDANILIDYAMADEDIIRELSEYWQEVIVPDIVLNEVDLLDEKRAEELGLKIIPTPLSELKPHKALSPEDCACLYFTVKHNAFCLTNDKALRKACIEQGKQAIWGLEMLLKLFRSKQVKKMRIKDIATKISKNNPLIGEEILTSFFEKLNKS